MLLYACFLFCHLSTLVSVFLGLFLARGARSTILTRGGRWQRHD
jgi:hypothetical protein